MRRPPTLWRRALLPVSLAGLAAAAWVVSSLLGNLSVDVAQAEPSDKVQVPLVSARRLGAATDSVVVERRLDEHFAALDPAPTDRACVSVMVDGRPVWSDNGDRPLVAGVARMFETAYTALERLGPEHRFETRLVAAPPVDGVVNSNLYLVGGGDPVLMTKRYASTETPGLSVRTPIEDLADALIELEVESIGGSVVGIGARHDQMSALSGWPSEYVETGIIGSLGALVIDDGYEVRPRGSALGVAAIDPDAHAAALFDDLLEARQVKISGLARSEIAEDDMTALATIAVVQSPPLSEIIAQMLAVADAGAAETILRELGVRATANGSTQAGAEVVRDAIIDLGLDMRLAPRDGSGIDPVATTTCDHLAGVVTAVSAADPDHPALAALGSYDLPGVHDGTLAGLELTGQVDAVGGTVGATTGLLARRAPTGTEPEVVMVAFLNRNGGPRSTDLAYHRHLLDGIDDIAALATAQAPGLGE